MKDNFKLDIKSRPRRLRRNASILSLCQENFLRPADLILPIFITEGESAEITSMPDVQRLSIKDLLKKCEQLVQLGIPAIALFPNVGAELKSDDAKEAYNPQSLQNKAIRAVKENFSNLQIVADIALDPYTTHGHDGILNADGTWILNDETVEILAKMSVAAAEAGADIIAPSDMMDGRIGAIREALDGAKFFESAIMAYSAKYASAFYGPFRDAIGSKKAGAKALDKCGYQLNPANSKEAMHEAELDELEGADILMVKPAGYYLDIVSKIKERSTLPLAAYQVSGEYSMIALAAQKGFLDLKKCRDESLMSIKRAGADMILTYFAESFAKDFLAK